ncbi:MAG: glycosyltransferase [Acidimicrobiales bacterium]
MSTSVSVCLCSYNGAAHLGEQLVSLSEQTQSPDEVVVGDDGSRDGTPELLEQWAASVAIPVLIERRAEPVGHGANLESVLRRASSSILMICDQDDRWHPDKVRRLAQLLDAKPEAAGAFSDSGLIDDASEQVEGSLWKTLGFSAAEQAAVADGQGLAVLLRRNVVAGHALALRRDRLEWLSPLAGAHHADWWLAMGLLLDGGLLPVDERLVDYRLHSGNTVGLRSRTSAASRIESSDPSARSVADAALLEQLVARCDQLRPGLLSAEQRSLFEAKIAHSRLRGSLPSSRAGRLYPVAKALVSGRYHRSANGWRSALIDLAAPPR